MNLLNETIDELNAYDKSPDDILWISDGETYCDWNTFAKLANKEYDSGFGLSEVNLSLIVVGNDFWLERQEYDGSEWWTFKKFPTKPQSQGNIFVWE